MCVYVGLVSIYILTFRLVIDHSRSDWYMKFQNMSGSIINAHCRQHIGGYQNTTAHILESGQTLIHDQIWTTGCLFSLFSIMKTRLARSINSNRFTFLVPGFYFYGINRIGSTRDHRNLFKFSLAAPDLDQD